METFHSRNVSVVLTKLFIANILETRDYIIGEADRLFCQFGFKSVTMDDIAKHLGMSKKTIYQHFTDKDELVNILIRQKLEAQSCQTDELARVAENAVQEILFVITNINDLLSNINAKLFFDLQKYHPKAWMMFRDFREKKMQQAILINIERGMREGLYRKEIKADIITRMRLEQVDLVFSNHEHYTTFRYTLPQVMAEITQHFLYGLCTVKGHQLIEKYKQQVNN